MRADLELSSSEMRATANQEERFGGMGGEWRVGLAVSPVLGLNGVLWPVCLPVAVLHGLRQGTSAGTCCGLRHTRAARGGSRFVLQQWNDRTVTTIYCDPSPVATCQSFSQRSD